MRKIKDKKCPYDFVEVMACPSGTYSPLPLVSLSFLSPALVALLLSSLTLTHSGCVNGGGQIRSATKENPKALLARVEAAYNEATHTVPEQNEKVNPLPSPFPLSFFPPSPFIVLFMDKIRR